MFTEGLDERAISWVKEGSNVAQQTRSPLVEKYPLDAITNRPLLHKCSSLLSPKGLPPVKYHSGLLGPRPGYLLNSDGEEESVDSTPEDAYDNFSDTCEEGPGSSDSDLFSKPIVQCYEEEIISGESLMREPWGNSDKKQHRALVRGHSKENLRVEVAGYDACVDGKLQNRVHPETSPMADQKGGKHISHVHHFNGHVDQSFCDLGTPSAPPIGENGRDEGSLENDVDMKFKVAESTRGLSDFAQSQKVDVPQERPMLAEEDPQVPIRQINLDAQSLNYNTSAQNAWQTFIAYDACFRLCLNAWARNCMEAPEFLRDECMALRNAFGIQNFLLHPRGHIGLSSMQIDNKELSNANKGKKMIGQLEVEVKRVRIIPQRRRKLISTSSYRAMYIQAGAEYVKHVSSVIKSQINSLKATSFAVAPEETVSCWLKLKSSSDDESGSHVCMRPGTGDSHIFYPESEGDALLAEVHINKVNQGCATIQISQLADGNGESTKWWPIYNEEHDCIGKVHLSISITSSSDRRNLTKMLQGGPVVETMIYDLVLEAAMRAQQFQQKNLEINGVWKWLLNEFADYYGVSAAYTKLRYLSYIMNVATPTKECLELIYDLLLPIVRARGEKSLTRQERSILFDCEYQIRNLLAMVFHNYKSLDEFSTTGIADILGPIPDSAAPAIAPAVQIFTLLHDILSLETQNMLRNYFQTAAAKRCRRHMLETDEFMSNNSDVLADPMTISTAYMKMKALCVNISNEIQADIKIHNQHILPSSIDLPNITASHYSTELSKRLRGFLAACPPSRPSQHVAELLIATADFESDLDSWNIRPVHGGVVSRDLFHDYIMVWIQETRLHLLELCKSEKVSCSAVLSGFQISPFVEHMFEEIGKSITEYEVVINRWPQYLLTLENVVADVERAIIKELEKCYSDTLMPLKDGIPKILEKQMQKLTRRQSASSYVVPNQLGTFLNTLKRILDVLHSRVEETLKGWASYLTISDGTTSFGEQSNGVTVLLKKKYKKYTQGIVSKLVDNTQANRMTRLKRILEDTKEAEGEAEIRDRMQALCSQLADSVQNMHQVFSSRIFVAICRGLWDRMGQIVLSFLESRKENRIWYKASDYALGILDDLFASEMQKLLGNSLQDKDLDPPRSVNEARSILR